MRLNYLRTSDNYRNIYDVWVIRQSISDEEMASDVVINYGDDTDSLNLNFNKNLFATDFKQQLIAKWPELGPGKVLISSYY